MRIYNNGVELQSTGHELLQVSLSPTVDTTIKRSGAASWKFTTTGSGKYIETSAFKSTADGVLFSRIAVYFTSFPSSGSSMVLWHISQSSGSTIASINITSGGVLQLKDGDNAAAQVGSDSSALSTSTWYVIELKTDNGGSPEMEARLGTVSFASGSMTAANNAGRIGFGLRDSVTSTLNVDDIAANDSTNFAGTGGSSGQNSWVGDSKIIILRPNAAGDANMFATQVGGTAGSSNNFTRVNEVTPDDATSYNGSNTANDEDMFNVDASGIGSNDVVNVVTVYGRRRESASGTGPQFRLQIRKTAAGTTGIPYPTGTVNTTNSTSWSTVGQGTQDTYHHSHYNDPDGNPWTQSTLDSMQIGYKLNTSTTNLAWFTGVWAYVDYSPFIPHQDHTTDANKRKATTVTHTSDANKRKTGLTRTHTTDTLKRVVLTRTHTTSSNRKLATVKTHTTDSNKRKATLVTHSTDSNKRKATTRTHTTDSFLRKQFTRTHTTDAFRRVTNTRTHTTNSNRRKATLVTYTTDALKRKTNVVIHTTDARTYRNEQTLSIDYFEFVFGTASFETTHTTDANKRRAATVSHTTDSKLRKANTVSHSTDSNKRRAASVTHTTSANLRKATLVQHTTDANKKRAQTVVHTTDANKRVSGTLRTHTTDSFLRRANTRTHTTDSNRRKATTVSHTTDSFLRRQITRTHTTDSNRKKATTVSHTADANKRKAGSVSHTTDALKRKVTTVSHTTDSNKKKAATASHTTSSYLRDRRNYQYEADPTLPTDNSDLANSYTAQDYIDSATDDTDYVCVEGSSVYLVHQFKYEHTNNTDTINITWKGKASLAPSATAVYLDVYNYNTDTWDNLDSDNATATETEFTLAVVIDTNVSNYYENNIVTARVRQEV